MIKVRPFQYPDLDRFANLYRKVFPEKNITNDQVENFVQDESTLIYLLDEEDADQLIGFLYCRTVANEIQIIDMGIVKKYRRQKFGFIILSHLFEEASKDSISKITLEVRSDNQAALGLYENMGFARTSKRKQYYGDGCDAILMDLPLGESPKS